MKFSVFDSRQAQEVIALCIRVFSDSEGQDEGKLIGKLVSELITTSPQDLFGFVATNQEKVVACIFFSRLTFQNNTNAFILSPVAVDTSHQGKGIGQQLIKFGIRHLKDQGVELVFTYGDPNFYQKVGFKPISEDDIKAPLKLTHPDGWLGQSLTNATIIPIAGASRCVEALNKQEYW
ncbi:MAG: N-acetyltransferase [Balneolaceae bacterium]|jgi:putative acetyltransferase